MITPEDLRAGTVDQLKRTQDRIVEELKYRKTMAVMEKKATLKPGDRFISTGLSPERHNGKFVTIKTVKKTRVSVIFDGEQLSCTIPISCLKDIEKVEPGVSDARD